MMGYQVHPKCVVCDRLMGGMSGEAYTLAKSTIGKCWDEISPAYASFDSTKKFIICTSCLMSLVLEKKYGQLSMSPDVAAYLKFHVIDGTVRIGPRKNRVLTEKSSQEDANKLIREVAIELLKGEKK